MIAKSKLRVIVGDEVIDYCAECELGNHKVVANKVCSWCGNWFCDSCAKELLTKKDDEGSKICQYCYDDAISEARAEAQAYIDEYGDEE